MTHIKQHNVLIISSLLTSSPSSPPLLLSIISSCSVLSLFISDNILVKYNADFCAPHVSRWYRRSKVGEAAELWVTAHQKVKLTKASDLLSWGIKCSAAPNAGTNHLIRKHSAPAGAVAEESGDLASPAVLTNRHYYHRAWWCVSLLSVRRRWICKALSMQGSWVASVSFCVASCV